MNGNDDGGCCTIDDLLSLLFGANSHTIGDGEADDSTGVSLVVASLVIVVASVVVISVAPPAAKQSSSSQNDTSQMW